MGFCRKVDNCIYPVLLHHLIHVDRATDVALIKMVVRVVGHGRQIVQVTGVGEFVINHKVDILMFS